MTSKLPGSASSDTEIDAAQQSEPNSSTKSDFPVVGIAASAGGLEAFTQLLSHLLIDTGMAFVLILHLAPDRESLLTEILARATKMRVCKVQNGSVVEPNHVYVIPPNTQMRLVDGLLELSPREKVFGKYMPGDTFFTSLAADGKHKAIAIVLSGGDGDGSLGLTAIKAAGGVTLKKFSSSSIDFAKVIRVAVNLLRGWDWDYLSSKRSSNSTVVAWGQRVGVKKVVIRLPLAAVSSDLAPVGTTKSSNGI
jgi:chemotaxis response regulator CheB